MTPLVPTPILGTKEPDFLSTAFERYSDALLSPGPYEKGIASAVACLEALFLGDSLQSEITYRLTRRVAALLGMCGWPATEVREKIKTAYDIRSSYVHGSVPTRKKKPTLDQRSRIFEMTAEHARIAFLIMAQLTEWKMETYKKTISDIEDSLIDDVHRTKLIERCKQIEFGRGPRMTQAPLPQGFESGDIPHVSGL